MLADGVSTQPIISTLTRIFNEEPWKNVLGHCIFVLPTNMWRTLKILQSTILLDAGIQARKLHTIFSTSSNKTVSYTVIKLITGIPPRMSKQLCNLIKVGQSQFSVLIGGTKSLSNNKLFCLHGCFSTFSKNHKGRTACNSIIFISMISRIDSDHIVTHQVIFSTYNIFLRGFWIRQ